MASGPVPSARALQLLSDLDTAVSYIEANVPPEGYGDAKERGGLEVACLVQCLGEVLHHGCAFTLGWKKNKKWQVMPCLTKCVSAVRGDAKLQQHLKIVKQSTIDNRQVSVLMRMCLRDKMLLRLFSCLHMPCNNDVVNTHFSPGSIIREMPLYHRVMGCAERLTEVNMAGGLRPMTVYEEGTVPSVSTLRHRLDGTESESEESEGEVEGEVVGASSVTSTGTMSKSVPGLKAQPEQTRLTTSAVYPSPQHTRGKGKTSPVRPSVSKVSKVSKVPSRGQGTGLDLDPRQLGVDAREWDTLPVSAPAAVGEAETVLSSSEETDESEAEGETVSMAVARAQQAQTPPRPHPGPSSPSPSSPSLMGSLSSISLAQLPFFWGKTKTPKAGSVPMGADFGEGVIDTEHGVSEHQEYEGEGEAEEESTAHEGSDVCSLSELSLESLGDLGDLDGVTAETDTLAETLLASASLPGVSATPDSSLGLGHVISSAPPVNPVMAYEPHYVSHYRCQAQTNDLLAGLADAMESEEDGSDRYLSHSASHSDTDLSEGSESSTHQWQNLLARQSSTLSPSAVGAALMAGGSGDMVDAEEREREGDDESEGSSLIPAHILGSHHPNGGLQPYSRHHHRQGVEGERDGALGLDDLDGDEDGEREGVLGVERVLSDGDSFSDREREEREIEGEDSDGEGFPYPGRDSPSPERPPLSPHAHVSLWHGSPRQGGRRHDEYSHRRHMSSSQASYAAPGRDILYVQSDSEGEGGLGRDSTLGRHMSLSGDSSMSDGDRGSGEDSVRDRNVDIMSFLDSVRHSVTGVPVRQLGRRGGEKGKERRESKREAAQDRVPLPTPQAHPFHPLVGPHPILYTKVSQAQVVLNYFSVAPSHLSLAEEVEREALSRHQERLRQLGHDGSADRDRERERERERESEQSMAEGALDGWTVDVQYEEDGTTFPPAAFRYFTDSEAILLQPPRDTKPVPVPPAQTPLVPDPRIALFRPPVSRGVTSPLSLMVHEEPGDLEGRGIALAAQGNLCPWCRVSMTVTRDKPLFCWYTGRLYCRQCMSGSLSLSLPARMVSLLDATPKPVCTAAYDYVSAYRPLPSIPEQAMPSTLLRHNGFAEGRRLRHQLARVQPVLNGCMHHGGRALLRQATLSHGLGEHLTLPDKGTCRMWAQGDIEAVLRGDFSTTVGSLLKALLGHVQSCSRCPMLGQLCRVCQQPPYMFAFSDATVRCRSCKHLIHEACFETGGVSNSSICPACRAKKV
ncbi:hypothetical protein KIPB_004264 [Kipferlia bialata]|uniref:RING-type domain-containing protein n=1 Tax=Kipferlia bialata TaxID=797122 RepID=A0A9K3CTH4_9EUKA|nr:hypothetical protein KIPB_004264 [Kipferlia bialata]|eukprot:g4264.t1